MLPRAGHAVVLLLLAAEAALAAGPPRVVSFREDVFPILSGRCLRCHKGTNPSSGVRLDSLADLLGETNGRPQVVPGKPDASRLLLAVRGQLKGRLMPPEGRGKRLTARQVEALRAWVAQGAKWDESALPSGGVRHRFFLRVARPDVPSVPGAATPVDAFLGRAHGEKGLKPVGEAPRPVLARRLYLDLTGLPPSPEQVEGFVRDNRPDAYERLVERLLASPRYGERWGRHWLDVARYADSEGYESNHLRPHAWRYRDWVVVAFNRDLAFGEFMRLQVAGDEVKPYADGNLVATGFLAAARLSSNEEDMPRQRNDFLVDVVNTTSSAFLGLTMQCAQCHNHKFDPITARDYYRFQAFFLRGQLGNLALEAPQERRRWRASLPEGYLEAKARRAALLRAARARLVAAAKEALPAEERAALAVDTRKRDVAQEKLARRAELKFEFSDGKAEKALTGGEREEYAALARRLKGWEKSAADEPQTFGYLAPATAAKKVRMLPMKGFYPLRYDPERLSLLTGRILVGGDVHNLGPVVGPGWPAVFGPTPERLGPTPRLALARWLADPANPLTARVWVNRVWGWHFGRGLVATPEDFGVKGAAASHPELLDWLAGELVRTGSTKHLHRLIVGSRAYRLASAPNAANERLDPGNVYLWRWMPRRLESEVVRDSLLVAAGELDARMGGPGDGEEEASRRRGVYLLQKRDRPAMVNQLFDGPSACAESRSRRGTSTVPLQPLYLLNNPFAVGRARALAERVRRAAGGDRGRQVDWAFRIALCRAPSAGERAACLRFFERHGGAGALEAFCQAVVNLNEFVYLE